jgi:hypothetical protein
LVVVCEQGRGAKDARIVSCAWGAIIVVVAYGGAV